MMTTCVYRDVNWSNVFNDSVDKYKILKTLSTKCQGFYKGITECEKNKTKNYINIEVHQSKLIETGFFSGKETVIKRIQMAIDEIMKKTNKIVTTTTIKPTGIENNVGKNTLMQNDDDGMTSNHDATGNTDKKEDISPPALSPGKPKLEDSADSNNNNLKQHVSKPDELVVTTTTIKPTGIENNVGKNTLMQNDDEYKTFQEWVPEKFADDEKCEQLKNAMSMAFIDFKKAVVLCRVEGGEYHLNLSTELLVQIGLFGSDRNLADRLFLSIMELETMEQEDVAVVKMVLQVENVDNSRNKENSIEYLHFLDTYCDAVKTLARKILPKLKSVKLSCDIDQSEQTETTTSNQIAILLAFSSKEMKKVFSTKDWFNELKKRFEILGKPEWNTDEVLAFFYEFSYHAMGHLPASAESNEPIIVNEKDLKLGCQRKL
ncbi:hypothetical protein EWB00_010184, partial [Schistosoma japonicum]